MRKTIIYLILVILCSCYYNASATITVTIGTVSAVPGSVVNIPITISGATGESAFWGLEYHINYDNTKISTVGGQYNNHTNLMTAGGWFGNINYNTTTMMGAYENGNNFTNITLPDNTILYNVQVIYTGSNTTELIWNNASTMFNSDGTILTVNWINGGVNPSIALSAPSLITPANNASGQSLNQSLTWNRVTNATSYRVQVSTNNTFTALISNVIETDTTKVLSGLSNNTTYYWRVGARNSNDTSLWSELRSFTTGTAPGTIDIPNSWIIASENSGMSSTIGFQIGGIFTVGNREFQPGDAIGAFFDRSGARVCAGYLIWNGTNLGFIVNGDNSQTTLKDGFAVNENYFFKVWDGQLGIEWPAQFTVMSGLSSFTDDGMTVLSSVNAITTITQNIPLNAGWNMISGYVTPPDLAITNVTSGISNQMVIIKNGINQVYWYPYLTTLTTWDIRHGYKINVNAACTLSITGNQILPETNPIPFSTVGWHLMPYYRSTSMPVETALAGINGNYTQVKSSGNSVYWPPYLNSLTNLEANKGYLIYISNATSLTYPANTPAGTIGKVNGNTISQEPQYLIPEYSNTGANSTLALEINGAAEGDEFGVFTQSGLLIGASVYTGSATGIVIWADNELTEIRDGAVENEELILKLFKISENKYYTINIVELTDLASGANVEKLVYTTNGIYLGKAETVILSVCDAELDISVSPQPIINEAFIKLNYVADNAVIELIDYKGSMIAKYNFNNTNTFRLDLTNIATGMYNLIIKTDFDVYQSKIIKISN